MTPQTESLALIWDTAHDVLEGDVCNNAALLEALARIRSLAAEGLQDTLAVFTPTDNVA